MIEQLHRQAQALTELGYDAIPLEPGAKVCKMKGWGSRPPGDLWKQAKAAANIGIRGGGARDLLVIDADEKNLAGSVDNAARWLAGQGLRDMPTIRTVSGGAHYYLSVSDAPRHIASVANLTGDIAGELRFGSGAYVVAPHSTIDGRAYELIAGDWRILPTVAWSDVAKLAAPIAQPQIQRIAQPRTQLDLLPMPTRDATSADLLRSALERAQAGNGRNLTGFWLALELRRRGLTMHQAAAVLSDYQMSTPGGSHPYTWDEATASLQSAYSRTLTTAIVDPAAILLAEQAMIWAHTQDWQGRSARNDKAVFLAHCEIMHRAGAMRWHASARVLAEMTGLAFKTAANTNERLIASNMLRRDDYELSARAAFYTLGEGLTYTVDGQTYTFLQERERGGGRGETETHAQSAAHGKTRANQRDSLDVAGAHAENAGQAKHRDEHSKSAKHSRRKSAQPPPPSPLYECVSLSILAHGVFDYKRGLGTSAGHVYAALKSAAGMTSGELAKVCNMHERTARRALAKLAEHSLAVMDGGLWRTGDNNLDAVARRLGTKNKSTDRAKAHNDQRQAWLENAPPPAHTSHLAQLAQLEAV